MHFISNLKIKYKMAMLALLPVLVISIAALAINEYVIKDKLHEDVKMELKSTAESVLAAYEQNTGDYFVNSAGDLWKGSYNISLSEPFIDNLKSKTDIDITFFYGDTRIVTSLKDKDGIRLKDSKAGQFLVEHVLKDGNDVFTNRVQVEEQMYYGYYIPVSRGNGEIIGMIFAGLPTKQVDASTNTIAMVFIITIISVTLLTLAISLLAVSSISKGISNCVTVVEEMSKGNLTVELNPKMLARHDEIGIISKSTLSLRDNLKAIIGILKENTDKLAASSAGLDNTANKTSDYMEQVKGNIEEVANGASTQARETISALEGINRLGSIVSNTELASEELKDRADKMNKTSNEAKTILLKLKDINSKTVKSVEEFKGQTEQTNESISNIQAAADVITQIADQTNLLSLNASIEAARAGEAGRGFAVVASEISKLAEQSSASAAEITKIITELMTNANKSVEIMNEVSSVINSQDAYVSNTEDAFNKVKEEVDGSFENIKAISNLTDDLVNVKVQIEAVLNELSGLAEENAASSEENSATVTEVAAALDTVVGEITRLNQIAVELEESTSKFSL